MSLVNRKSEAATTLDPNMKVTANHLYLKGKVTGGRIDKAHDRVTRYLIDLLTIRYRCHMLQGTLCPQWH